MIMQRNMQVLHVTWALLTNKFINYDIQGRLRRVVIYQREAGRPGLDVGLMGDTFWVSSYSGSDIGQHLSNMVFVNLTTY